MTNKKRVLRVFLSSPGDLGAQRDLARQVIGALNFDPLISPEFVVEVVGWDTPGARVPIGANETPQASVNTFLPQPRHCDLTIVLLWGRLGTPLPADWIDSQGQPYQSGTVWELENARQAGCPVWVYHRTTPPQISIDDPGLPEKRAQFDAVRAFIGTARASDGSLRFGVHSFEDDEQLRSFLTEHLRHFVGRLMHSGVDVEAMGASDSSVDEARLIGAHVAAMAAAEMPDMVAPAEIVLRRLEEYPIGPMMKDMLIGALAQAIAELSEGTHPRNLFAHINDALSRAAEPGRKPVRLAVVSFPSSMGSSYFWEEVLHWAAVQGPRTLAATLGAVDPRRLEGEALTEYRKLVVRLNSYV